MQCPKLAEGRDPKLGSRLLFTNEIFQASKRRGYQDRAPESVARSRSEARGFTRLVRNTGHATRNNFEPFIGYRESCGKSNVSRGERRYLHPPPSINKNAESVGQMSDFVNPVPDVPVPISRLFFCIPNPDSHIWAIPVVPKKTIPLPWFLCVYKLLVLSSQRPIPNGVAYIAL
jgi:hypothetical protein